MAHIGGLGMNLFSDLHLLTICIFWIKNFKERENPKQTHFRHWGRKEYENRKDVSSSQVTLNCTRTSVIPIKATTTVSRLRGAHPQELKARTWADLCTLTTTARLLPFAKRWEQLRCPLTHERINNGVGRHAYSETSFSREKEGNTGTCYNTDKPWGNYAKGSQSATKRWALLDFPSSRYLGKFIDTK